MTSKYHNYEFHLGGGPLVRVQALTPLDARVMEIGGAFIRDLKNIDQLLGIAQGLGERAEEISRLLSDLNRAKIRSNFVPWYMVHNYEEKVAGFWTKDEVIVVMAESGVDAYSTLKDRLGIISAVWYENLESTGKTEICANYEQVL